jgi:hypothetical protein
MWTALLRGMLAATVGGLIAYLVNQLPDVNIRPSTVLMVLLLLFLATAYVGWRLRPQPVKLGMANFTMACRAEYADPNAVARLTPRPDEYPSSWVKCFNGTVNLGGFSIEQYCNVLKPGMHAHNPKRTGPKEDEPWLKWECASG